jgi:DNA-binding LacI/PurR family transcriptional regulator
MGTDSREMLGARPTLEEVAAVAGVSRATVSRVVNDRSNVSEAARAAVQRAIDQTGYVPNRAARTLVTRRTDSVALVITEPERRLFAEPFFADVVRGMSHVLATSDIQLVLLMSQSDDDRLRTEQFLVRGHVDGALLLSLHAEDPLPRNLVRHGLPVVTGGRPLNGNTGIPCVDVDNRGGGRTAVEHLLATGRRRIGHITGSLDMAPGVDRRAGYRDALAAAGIEVDQRLEVVGDFGSVSGSKGAIELLERVHDLDAIFAGSDLMAAGALQALARRGRRIPDDVAVIGFDDSEIARSSNPALSSIRQPVELMGKKMAALLVQLLSQAPADDGRSDTTVILPTELVIRETT